MIPTHDLFLIGEGIRTAATLVASGILLALAIARWRNLTGYTGIFYSLSAVTFFNGVRGFATLDRFFSGAIVTEFLVATVLFQALAGIAFALCLALAYRELRGWQSPAMLIERNQRLQALLEDASYRALNTRPMAAEDIAHMRAGIRAAITMIEADTSS